MEADTAETTQQTKPEAAVPEVNPKFASGCATVMSLIPYVILFWAMFSSSNPHMSQSSHGETTTAPESSSWLLTRYGWCVLIMAVLAYPLIKGEARKHLGLFRQIRLRMVLENFLLIVVVLACAYGLYLFCPFLDRSWLYRFPLDGGQAANIGILPAYVKYLSPFFMVLLVLNLPALAHSEEKAFREGTKDWRDASWRSLRFGLAHCFMGVPLYIGLALSLGGLWFTHQYFQGGVERSAAHHLTYNLLVATALTISLFAAHIAF